MLCPFWTADTMWLAGFLLSKQSFRILYLWTQEAFMSWRVRSKYANRCVGDDTLRDFV